ncbi:MAG: hypothetical protein GY928_40605 [Colwellia sp.]|nr:hypothetical protein [Colwellia sp.]
MNVDAIKQQVTRLQMRIVKAVKEGKYGKMKSLQWLLTHSKASIYFFHFFIYISVQIFLNILIVNN